MENNFWYFLSHRPSIYSQCTGLSHSNKKNCQLEIRNEMLQEKLKKVMCSEFEAQGRYCNGKFVWKLLDFPELHKKMRTDCHFVVYSKGFYTSVFGYKVCLRSNINLVNGEEYLGVFVHLMRGDNDSALSWPFRGQISLTAVREISENFFETIKEIPEGSKAFERPISERNPTGFGFTEFIRVNALYSGGFINTENTLILKAELFTMD
ncbi:TRAF6 [Lepeophtheirus salmonis]|uniref:TRAF6 n=1 Tax=Lepeophtheirus salmonis TaxID=72036 RepID=A0A7R8H1G1_LEPSM|nr:TRAF6 [Lepeophtheirus salmonis]CAF2810871.1 TRAF6 [Lepeophtheirus salmonis]